jgi:hypothetical protein
MYSIDRCWINDENLFQTPIDKISAAAHILDPAFIGGNKPDIPKASGIF